MKEGSEAAEQGSPSARKGDTCQLGRLWPPHPWRGDSAKDCGEQGQHCPHLAGLPLGDQLPGDHSESRSHQTNSLRREWSSF